MKNSLNEPLRNLQSEYAEKMEIFKNFIKYHYELRFNTLSQQAEYRSL